MFKIIFFGTSDFAIPALENLVADKRFEIVGIVTQPNRPVGRHAILTAPPVRNIALTLTTKAKVHIPIMQPERLKDETFRKWIEEVGPFCDAFVVISYGKLLPQWLLDIPKKGVVNLHGSFLPRWRGASPIQAAIAAGDKITGVTIMKIDAKMDHGPILAIAEEIIQPTDTSESLHDRLSVLGGDILPGILYEYLSDTIQPQEQDHPFATTCGILTRNDGKLNPLKTATELERLIRAYRPWPETWIEKDGKRLKILTARIAADVPSKKSGEIFTQNNLLYLACAGGTVLELLTVQPEGKKKVDAAGYLIGARRLLV